MRLWKLEIESKTDVLAFAAFLLSIGAVIAQLSRFFLGAQIVPIPPDEITFQKRVDDPQLVNVVARTIYVNKGAQGYPEIILRERLTVYIEGRPFEFTPRNIGSLQGQKDGSLILKDAADALPFLVDGGDVAAHHVQYFSEKRPDGTGNYLRWSDLLAAAEQKKTIEVGVVYETLNKASKERKCSVHSWDYYDTLKSNDWVKIPCIGDNKN